MTSDTNIWCIQDEKKFLMQLGKRNKTESKYCSDRRFSTLSRLELLDNYLELCLELRERWDESCPQKAVIEMVEDYRDREIARQASLTKSKQRTARLLGKGGCL